MEEEKILNVILIKVINDFKIHGNWFRQAFSFAIALMALNND